MRRIAALSIVVTAVLSGGLAAQLEPSDAIGLDAPRLAEPPAGTPLTGAELEARTEELAARLRCPSCQALSVADSPTDSSRAIRQEIRELLAAGYSDEQVMSYFELSYGEFIRLAPKPSGFNLFVWLAPILALLAGLALVVFRIRSARSDPGARSDEPQSSLDPYLERVRKEIGG